MKTEFLLYRVLFHDISFSFAQNSWNIFLKNKAYMATMDVLLDLGRPSCYAIKSTATFAWRPCWTGILKASPFLEGTSLFWWSAVVPGLPNGFTELSSERHSRPTASLNLLPFLPCLLHSGSVSYCSQKALLINLLPHPLHILSHDIPPNQILTHLISSSCLLFRGPRLRQYKCLLT